MTERHRPRTALVWERFGEYHHARAEAAGRLLDLHVVEVVARDTTYAWDEADAREGYAMHRLNGAEIAKVFDQIRPEVVAVPGWKRGYALDAICWARANGARVVMMSDSNYDDLPRSHFKEWLKRGVVTQAQAGLAAGAMARAYLARLGLEPSRIATGYDVVDNAHFAPNPEKAPGRGFLAVARFVEKKNLITLIDAYAGYCADVGSDAWPLTIAGSGEQRAALEERIAELGLAEVVQLPGFVQYAALPGLYHAAGALVLPSTVEQWGLVVNEAMAAGLPVLVSEVAGCAPDLVRQGENGYTFDPTDAETLARLMLEIAANSERTVAMGVSSREIVGAWGTDAFATGLKAAVKNAIAAQPPRNAALRLRLLRHLPSI